MALQVTLGGKPYPITPLPRKQARQWRGQLQATLDPVLAAAQQVLSLDLEQGVNIGIVVDLVRAQIIPLLLSYPDMAWDLLLAYAPNLASQHEMLDETATDEEVIAAFVEVLKQAYPLGGLTSLLGRVTGQTSTNSPTPNGASTRTTSTKSNARS